MIKRIIDLALSVACIGFGCYTIANDILLKPWFSGVMLLCFGTRVAMDLLAEYVEYRQQKQQKHTRNT